jgi:predicted dehydrogenase
MTDSYPIHRHPTVGVVGLGKMGQNHLRVLKSMKSIQIGFVSEIDEELGQRVASDFGVPHLANPEDGAPLANSLIIATSSQSHYSITRSCLAHFRSILVEKPLTLDSQTTHDLLVTARELETQIQVGFIERFNPAIQALQKVLHSRPTPETLEFRRVGKLVSHANQIDVVRDLMIHDIDLALLLAGPIVSIDGIGYSRADSLQMCHALVRHQSGTISHFHTSYISQKKQRQIRATHEDYTAEVDLTAQSLVVYEEGYISDPVAGEYVSTNIERQVHVNRSEPLLNQLRSFFDKSEGAWHETPGPQAALESILVCESLLEKVRVG